MRSGPVMAVPSVSIRFDVTVLTISSIGNATEVSRYRVKRDNIELPKPTTHTGDVKVAELA